MYGILHQIKNPIASKFFIVKAVFVKNRIKSTATHINLATSTYPELERFISHTKKENF